MKTGFLQLLGGILVPVLSERTVHADIAPPPTLLLGVGVGALIVLGLFIAGIVVVSVLVIRAIKKNRAHKDDA